MQSARLRSLVLATVLLGLVFVPARPLLAEDSSPGSSLGLGIGAAALPLAWGESDAGSKATLGLPAWVRDSAAAVQEDAAAASRHPAWLLDYESKMWPGFLTGLPGYDDFVMPVGNFIYFEDPFITTDLRLAYVYHDIPDDSVLRGGQIHVIAAQIRIALSERLALIATKDGYTWIDTHITSEGEGWNDFTLGLKYAFHSNPEEQFLISGGIRWELANGSSAALQGGSQELSPFIAMAKGWDRCHFLGTLSGRIPTNRHSGNYSLIWNLHLDYALTETFRPLIEVHGIHWLSNGNRLPFSTDYLDVGSIGASEAAGRDFFSAGLGFRWQAMENISVGLVYEFPLESASQHLMQQRVTLNTVISF